MSIANALSGARPQQEMVIGSYDPDDMVVVDRSVAFQFVYKWVDPDLYQTLVTGSDTGTAWTPTVYESSVWAKLQSPGGRLL